MPPRPANLRMNPNHNIENSGDLTEEIELDDFGSVDDFIKQLEAREKDLRISSDLVIEVGDSEFDDRDPPGLTMEIIPETPVHAPPKIIQPKAIEPAAKKNRSA